MRARSYTLSVQGVRWVTICEHGRLRSQCKECGGGCNLRARSSALIIARSAVGVESASTVVSAHECKECGGKEYASTVVGATVCKECGGGSICEHGRQRFVCKECGGAGICEHGRLPLSVQGVRWVTNLRARSCAL